MVIFHSYVSLPEGKLLFLHKKVKNHRFLSFFSGALGCFNFGPFPFEEDERGAARAGSLRCLAEATGGGQLGDLWFPLGKWRFEWENHRKTIGKP